MYLIIFIFILATVISRRHGYLSPVFGFFAILINFGAQFIGATLINYHQYDILIKMAFIVVFGFTISVGSVILLMKILPLKNHRQLPKKSNFPYRLTGFFFAAISLPAPLILTLYYRNNQNYSPLFIILASMASYCFIMNSRQNIKLMARNMPINGNRSPVLFLRSFSISNARIPGPITITGFLFFHPDFLKRLLGLSFDEFIALNINSEIGPMIALGDPDDYLPTHGSVKIYSHDESWKETVIDFIRRSGIVLLLEGSSPGLAWELQYIRNNVPPSRIFIITLGNNFRSNGWLWRKNPRKNIWMDFPTILHAAGFPKIEDPGPGAIITFSPSWNPIIISQGSTKSEHYVNSIKQAVGSDVSPIGGLNYKFRRTQ